MCTNKSDFEYVKDKYGQPVKAAIWFGNPFIPWPTADVPGGKLGQELVINANGQCQLTVKSFNDESALAISGQPSQLLTMDSKQAGLLLDQILATINYLGSTQTTSTPAEPHTTVWNDQGEQYCFGNYLTADPDTIFQLSMTIRDALNRADLMVLDGNGREDFIDQFEVEYSENTGYRENITLQRASDQLIYWRQIGEQQTVTSTYHYPGSIRLLLDRLDPVELTKTIPGAPADAVADNNQLGRFECLITRRNLKPVEISGQYEKYHLPAPWASLMTALHQLMAVPSTGPLVDDRYYHQQLVRQGEVIYLAVRFTKDGPLYNYQTTDNSIMVGDWVVVPVGADNHEQTVPVVKKNYYLVNEVPYPLDSVKKVIRRAQR